MGKQKGGDEVSYLVKHKKIFAFVTAFLVTAVLLLSGFFIVTHTEHECTGEDCPVCAELQACAATIRLITEAAGTGAVVIFAYIITQKLLISYQTGLYMCPVSLVSLKIRLDN